MNEGEISIQIFTRAIEITRYSSNTPLPDRSIEKKEIRVVMYKSPALELRIFLRKKFRDKTVLWFPDSLLRVFGVLFVSAC
ncbi:hypothetical protein TNCT_291001 [Trichonephila clavata]|uniref:Uncharacterized protein n=1 Tax=Trichonephila clavata TaxID=2740835 RepID=A0A8X6K6I8_TRICU|nr:hypothetical protein TNCT_291001 [Trichonephila clavata]